MSSSSSPTSSHSTLASPALPTQLQILLAASHLLGLSLPLPSAPRSTDSLPILLHRRLLAFRAYASEIGWEIKGTLEELREPTSEMERELQYLTATHALQCLRALPQRPPGGGGAPQFGLKDIKILSTLASVISRWGVASRVVEGVLPVALGGRGKKGGGGGGGRISEVVEGEEEEEGELEGVVRGLVGLLRGNGKGGEGKGKGKGKGREGGRGELEGIVLKEVLVPLMGALVQLGYAPTRNKDEREWATEALDEFCRSNGPGIILASLLSLLSSSSSTTLTSTMSWLRPALSQRLSDQLLRPGGVRSLMLLVVGRESGDAEAVGLGRLEMLGKLLGTKGEGMSWESYLSNIVPQLLAIVTSASTPSPPPPPILRATSFILVQLITSHGPLLQPLFPTPFHPVPPPSHDPSSVSLDPTISSTPSLLSHLSSISTIILHAPPSDLLLPFFLHGTLPALLSLASYLDRNKVDEGMKDELEAILETWGKSTSPLSVVALVRGSIEMLEAGDEFGKYEGETGGFYYGRSEEGSVCIRFGIQEGGGGVEVKVQPDWIVGWLKRLDRKEVSGKLFLRWLDEVGVLRTEEGVEAAKRSVVRLGLVLKMVEEMGSEILKEPEQIIAFVAHAMDASETKMGEQEVERERRGFGLGDLKIVSDAEVDRREDEDEEGIVPGLGPDEMVMTALTLLLAVLEANEDLNMTTTPLLSLIFEKLPALASSTTSEIVPPLAREARLVLSVRLASSYTPTTASLTDPLAASRARYQEALKLLQDPILPLRAQGLAILRSLVVSPEALLSTDPALLPAVLDIFVQAIEDEDSFLYLNAIQGLSTLADVYGKQIVRRLGQVYLGAQGRVEEVGEGDKGRRELDKRLRIGEAMVQVVQRAGEALAVFVDDLVPILLLVLRTSFLPTTLRSSSLTILTTAVETAPISLLPHTPTLAEACLTLLSLESRPLLPRKRAATPPPPASTTSDSDDEDDVILLPPPSAPPAKLRKPEETPTPTSSNSQHPSLRRSAILFLGILFRTSALLAASSSSSSRTQQTTGYDPSNPLGHFRMGSKDAGPTRSALVGRAERQRAKVVLAYLRATDEDALVRHQAGEVLDELEDEH